MMNYTRLLAAPVLAVSLIASGCSMPADDPDADGAQEDGADEEAVASSSEALSKDDMKKICRGFWIGVACTAVVEFGGKLLWRMANGRDCVEKRNVYDVNPSNGSVTRTRYKCVRWR